MNSCSGSSTTLIYPKWGYLFFQETVYILLLAAESIFCSCSLVSCRLPFKLICNTTFRAVICHVTEVQQRYKCLSALCECCCCALRYYTSKAAEWRMLSHSLKMFFHYWDIQALNICQLGPRHISAQCTPVTRCLKANLISQASHNILKQDILRPNKTSNNSGILSSGNQPHCVWISVGNL